MSTWNIGQCNIIQSTASIVTFGHVCVCVYVCVCVHDPHLCVYITCTFNQGLTILLVCNNSVMNSVMC